jgi:alpha-ketoglutarate-dependent dioxygenase FTO
MTVHNKIKNKSFKSFQRNSSPVEHDNKIEVSQVKLTKQQKRDQKRKQQVISNNPTSIGNSNLLIKSSKKNETLTPSSENKNTISVYKRTTEYPQILPNFIGPKSRFITPSDECFTHVMDTSYKGYVTQVENDFSNDFHLMFQDAFEGLESSDVYQYDVTQPAGLGTKTAKTFVSRCLVGDAGTTYKYLGLRMFSIPWERDVVGSTKHSIMLGELNKQLIQRTKQLLKSLNKPQVGSCEYNLTLINR